MTATLSPSVHEATIARHFKKDEDDPALLALHAALKAGREAALKAAKIVNTVTANDLLTPASRHKKARDASFKLLEPQFKAYDEAVKATETAIAEIEARTAGPSAPKDLIGEARGRELRERLLMLPNEQRQRIISDAVQHDDDMLLSAVLGVPAWLLGMTTAEQEMIRHSWRAKHFAPELDRLQRLNKAVEDARRAGPLLLGFVDQLTDAKLIAAADATEAAANAALAEANSSGKPEAA